MNTRKVIYSIEILRAFQDQQEATTVSEIETSCSKSRATVHRFLDEAEDWKLVIRTPDGYKITAAGDLVFQQYDELEDQRQSDLFSLVGSEYGPILLGILADSPGMAKAEMKRRSDAARSTVQRNVRKFQSDDCGWLAKRNGRYQLSGEGRSVWECYESLNEKFETVEEKSDFLERYEGPLPPLDALSSARMAVSSVTDNQQVVREINKLDPGDAEPIRGVSQAFSEEISDAYAAKVPLETECELVVDRSVYKAVTNPKRWKYLFRSRERRQFRLLVHPENLRVGIGLFGDEQAMIAAYSAENPFHAGLFGESEVFVAWVEDVYESIRKEATSPGRDLFNWVTQ